MDTSFAKDTMTAEAVVRGKKVGEFEEVREAILLQMCPVWPGVLLDLRLSLRAPLSPSRESNQILNANTAKAT